MRYLIAAAALLAGLSQTVEAQSAKPAPSAPPVAAAPATPSPDNKASGAECSHDQMGLNDLGFGFSKGKREGMHGMRDGELTRDELRARPLAKFDLIDTNHDGVLTAEEMDSYIVQEAKRLREKMMGRLDANADGKISREEVSKMIDSRFDRMDANKDGKIGRDEMPQHHKKRHRGGKD